MIDDSFFGVFNKRGELECVESTENAATTSACNLSPHTNGKPPSAPLGRTVEPVTIIRGDLGAFMVHMLNMAADANVSRLHAAYEKARRQATTYDDKGHEVLVANGSYFEAKERLRTALQLRQALGEAP